MKKHTEKIKSFRNLMAKVEFDVTQLELKKKNKPYWKEVGEIGQYLYRKILPKV